LSNSLSLSDSVFSLNDKPNSLSLVMQQTSLTYRNNIEVINVVVLCPNLLISVVNEANLTINS